MAVQVNPLHTHVRPVGLRPVSVKGLCHVHLHDSCQLSVFSVPHTYAKWEPYSPALDRHSLRASPEFCRQVRTTVRSRCKSVQAVCWTSSPFRSSLFAPLSLQMPVSLTPLLLLLLLLIRVGDILFADVEHVVELSQALAVGDQQHPDQAQDSSARCQQTRGTQARNSRAKLPVLFSQACCRLLIRYQPHVCLFFQKTVKNGEEL